MHPELMRLRLRTLVSFLAATAGAAVGFVLTSSLMDQVPDAAVVGVPLLVAGAIAAASGWRLLANALEPETRTQAMWAAAAGVVALWAAPLLALVQRSTDAPSGAETLFFTVACWGLLAAASGLVVPGGWRRPRRFAAGALSLAGCAGLLASWERPSSFSPFAKFPVEELMMLLAGVVFVAGAYALAAASKGLGARATLTVALVAAALVGALFSLPAVLTALGALQSQLSQLTWLGVSVYVFSWGWINLISHTGVERAGSSLLVVPVALTALSAVERVTGVYGANPIVWSGAAAGMTVCLIAAAAVMAQSTPDQLHEARRAEPWFWPWMMWVSAVACVSGIVSLWLPAIDATTEGAFSEPFSAAWTMIGAESAAGWVAAAASVLCLAAVFEARRRTAVWSVAWSASAVVVAVCAYPFLLDTTLHTWNSWIPSDVLTSYGTEYARFTVDGVTEPVRTMTVAVVGAIALALLADAVRTFRGASTAHSEVH